MSEESKPALSRRTLLKAGIGGLGVVAVGFAGTASAQKIAPSMVQYQATPKDGNECDKCAQFIAPGSCKVVEGKISPKGWCAAFAPKG